MPVWLTGLRRQALPTAPRAAVCMVCSSAKQVHSALTSGTLGRLSQHEQWCSVKPSASKLLKQARKRSRMSRMRL